jgi:hypothetical protein
VSRRTTDFVISYIQVLAELTAKGILGILTLSVKPISDCLESWLLRIQMYGETWERCIESPATGFP